MSGPNERDCHPYDEVCREGAPCRNHGGIVGPNERANSKAGSNLENAGSSERDAIAALLHPWLDQTDRCPWRPWALCPNTRRSLALADAILASDWLAERDRRVAATAVREALGTDEEPDMLRAMLHDAADRLANPRHRGNEHAWPTHAAMFRHLADRIERGEQ